MQLLNDKPASKSSTVKWTFVTSIGVLLTILGGAGSGAIDPAAAVSGVQTSITDILAFFGMNPIVVKIIGQFIVLIGGTFTAIAFRKKIGDNGSAIENSSDTPVK